MPEPSHRGSTFRWSEVSELFKLALPVVFGELGWMTMSTVDLIMAGKLSTAALGAIGVGNSAFYTFAIMGIGLLLGLDTLVSQAFGAGQRAECRRFLTQGLWLALFLSLPLTALFWLMRPVFVWMHIDPEVSRLAASYLGVLSFSMPFLAIYAALRRYLQAIGHVRPVMVALLTANLVNWFFNWVLIGGHWGFPALGVSGSALSTVIARLYMALVLACYVWLIDRREGAPPQPVRRGPEWLRIRQILGIGIPAALQIFLEIGAFGMVGMLAAKLNQTALAAHQIALNSAAFTFMVPFGISSAASIAVGHAIGRGDRPAAKRAGYIALALGCVFMAFAGATFLWLPGPLLRLYTSDQAALAVGASLLAVGAGFQLFDGAQVIFTGALRGIGDTKTAMLVNLAGYWLLGLPVGYTLCFIYQRGVFGLWWGLTLSLVLIALVLWLTWQRSFPVKQATGPRVLAAR